MAIEDQHMAIESGSINPGKRCYRVPFTDQNAESLIAFADSHAAPEVCAHFILYSLRTIYLEAYDVCGNEILISPLITASRVRTFSEQAGGTLAKQSLEQD